MKSNWFNWNHLRNTEKYNTKIRENAIVLYFKHMYTGFREAGKQLLLAFASIIHAIFPPLFDFKLVDIVINQTIGLYKYLPNHPSWKKLKEVLKD